jgi:hypothetical protein
LKFLLVSIWLSTIRNCCLPKKEKSTCFLGRPCIPRHFLTMVNSSSLFTTHSKLSFNLIIQLMIREIELNLIACSLLAKKVSRLEGISFLRRRPLLPLLVCLVSCLTINDSLFTFIPLGSKALRNNFCFVKVLSSPVTNSRCTSRTRGTQKWRLNLLYNNKKCKETCYNQV